MKPSFCFSFVILFCFSTQILAAPPSREVQLRLFDRIASEMERLDGEGLFVRSNRSQPWNETVKSLRTQIQSDGLSDLAIALARLDLAYPNLHAYSEPGDELRAALGRRLTVGVRFMVDWLTEDQTHFRISSMDSNLPISFSDLPQVGDEVVAINGKVMAEWSDLNFNFCKHPLRAQCDTELGNGFIGRLLPLTQNQLLTYTLQRDGRRWEIQVPITPVASPTPRDHSHLECRNDPRRYPGFTASYTGNRLCIYESSEHPSTAIMRITSFAYRNLSDTQTIRSVQQEIEAVYPWWKEQANWKHLIIDLIDNGGGNEPIPYYQILLQKPFQEQYFELKKIPELLNESIREGIFWGLSAQEIWFQDILKAGIYAATPMGSYLPRLPMFCADEERNCNEGQFKPLPHSFDGEIGVLLNEWCVSSCDGFAYAIQEQFGSRAKFYGHPQAADTAYSRVTIHAFLDESHPDGFFTRVTPIRTAPDRKPFHSQTVSISRSVRADGTVVSGVPVPLNRFIPETLENRRFWISEVLKAALTDFSQPDEASAPPRADRAPSSP